MEFGHDVLFGDILIPPPTPFFFGHALRLADTLTREITRSYQCEKVYK